MPITTPDIGHYDGVMRVTPEQVVAAIRADRGKLGPSAEAQYITSPPFGATKGCCVLRATVCMAHLRAAMRTVHGRCERKATGKMRVL